MKSTVFATFCGVLLFSAVISNPVRHVSKYQTSMDYSSFSADAINAELQYWKETGNPDVLMFPGNGNDSVVGVIGNTGPESKLLANTARLFADYEKQVQFHLFTTRDESNVKGTIVSLNKEELVKAGMNLNATTKVIVHGFANNIESAVIQRNKNAYLLHAGDNSINVIGVNWESLSAAPFYISARLNVGGVASRLAKFVDFLITEGLTTPEKVHFIGHSLGAHVAGVAAKNMQSGKIKRVTGLDPARPLFLLTSASGRLDAGDADVVDVVHTNAGGLGFKSRIGTVDFYPNNGRSQPGCGIDFFGTCAHSRAYEYYAETIEHEKGFLGVYCNNDDEALAGACQTNDVKGVMGDTLRFRKEGSYFLKTASQSPFNLAHQKPSKLFKNDIRVL